MDHSDRDGLMRAYDEEASTGFGLTDLTEESEDEAARNGNGHATKSYGDTIEMQPPKTAAR